MSDIADMAGDRQEVEMERAIAAARGHVYRAGDVPESADNCVECGTLIPSGRQLATPGCQLCVGCAEIHELRRNGL